MFWPLRCHWYCGAGVPLATIENVTVLPWQTGLPVPGPLTIAAQPKPGGPPGKIGPGSALGSIVMIGPML